MTTSAFDNQPLHILVPLDGSVQSVRALEVASQLPASKITLLRVEPADYLLVPGITAPDSGEIGDSVMDALVALAAPLRSRGVAVTTAIGYGDPASEIIDAARGLDLIVMTTRGQGAASRAIFGSVADRVSRHGETPTLLIRSDAESELTSPQRIVVPLDGSTRAEHALPLAARLASIIPAPLHLLRVVAMDDVRETIQAVREAGADALDIGETYEDAAVFTEAEALAYLETVAEPLRLSGVAVTTEILQGTPAFVLLWNTTADDLVVMTSHGRGGFRRWLLGSVAEKLVREGEAPLLLVPTRDKAE